MDPILLAVATNLISSAIWDLATDPAYADEYDFGERSSPAFASAVDEAVSKLTPALDNLSEDDSSKVEKLLDSDEIRQLVMQLYRTRVTDKAGALSTLREGMLKVWSARHPEEQIPLSIDLLLEGLISGCDALLDRGIKQEVLAAHEAMSAARHALLDERLRSIERQIALMNRPTNTSFHRVDAFERELREGAARVYGLLSLAGPEGHLAMTEDAYVAPPFSLEGIGTALYEELVGETFRLVVLGAPGSGKSTFAQKLCRDLALQERSLSGGLHTAGVLVRLRDLAPYGSADPGEEIRLRSKLGEAVFGRLTHRRDWDALEYLLTAGRLAIVFDGLDELPVPQERVSVRSDLDRFSERYPLVPLVITSRIVGYDNAPLDESRYRHAFISDYADIQVKKFVERWFLAIGEDPEEASSTAERLRADFGHMRELPMRPLMLDLVCAFHHRVGHLPRDPVRLYDACATLMFERWDLERGVQSHRHPYFYRAAIGWLAWRILKTPSLGTGITEASLARDLVHFFLDRFVDDLPEAEAAAEQLLHLLKNRASVFTEVGLTAADEPLFHFTHRTFLEFFAGEHVAAMQPPDAASEVFHLIGQDQEAAGFIAMRLAEQAAPTRERELGEALRALAEGTVDQQKVKRFLERTMPLDSGRT